MRTDKLRQSGQTLVEFALVIPLLALLLFAIIQYGFIFSAYITVKNASAVAARHAVVGLTPPSVASIESVARSAVAPMLRTNNVVAVNIDTNAILGGSGGAKSVQVQYQLPLVIPFVVPGKTTGGSLTISATTVMR